MAKNEEGPQRTGGEPASKPRRPVPGSRLLRESRASAAGAVPGAVSIPDEEFERWLASLSKKSARALGLDRTLRAKRAAWTFFCPQCRTPRALKMSPSPWKAHHLFQVALTAGVFALLASPWLSWKGIVAFVPFWGIFEIVYRLRLRAELFCRQCGLDPVLYLSDVNRARDEMVEYWRKKYEEHGLQYPPPPESLVRARVAARRKTARSPEGPLGNG